MAVQETAPTYSLFKEQQQKKEGVLSYDSKLNRWRDLRTGRFVSKKIVELQGLGSGSTVIPAETVKLVENQPSKISNFWKKGKDRFINAASSLLKSRTARFGMAAVLALSLDRSVASVQNQVEPSFVYASDQQITQFVGDNGVPMCVLEGFGYDIDPTGKSDQEVINQQRIATNRYLQITQILTDVAGKDCNNLPLSKYQQIKQAAQIPLDNDQQFNILMKGIYVS